MFPSSKSTYSFVTLLLERLDRIRAPNSTYHPALRKALWAADLEPILSLSRAALEELTLSSSTLRVAIDQLHHQVKLIARVITQMEQAVETHKREKWFATWRTPSLEIYRTHLLEVARPRLKERMENLLYVIKCNTT